jgi:hypothetical protein
MQTKLRKHKMYVRHWKMIGVMGVIVISIGILSSSFNERVEPLSSTNSSAIGVDSVASLAAYEKVYRVLMSPRCMNCHAMKPRRGEDGKGLYAMKCSNCHQPENAQAAGAPPGNPKWALPPADMKMVFQGRTPRELALQIMDYKRNGHKTKAQLIEHARDTLVKAGWNMGEGRKPPPLSYAEFVAAWDEWINKGGVAPK